MREKFYCLDCQNIAELDLHGRCPVCQSEAVVSAEAGRLNHERETCLRLPSLSR